jgi:hypothetical protein
MTSQAQDDSEFGAPEEVPIDINRQINHLMQSFSSDNIQLHWKISQHAAEIDHWKGVAAEKEAEVQALTQALESEMEHRHTLEGLLEKEQYITFQLRQGNDPVTQADDRQSEDGFLAMAAGQPGLASAPAPAE